MRDNIKRDTKDVRIEQPRECNKSRTFSHRNQATALRRMASTARGRRYKGSCATGVTSGEEGGGADCDAAGRAASHTNSSGGPDVMMDGMCLIPSQRVFSTTCELLYTPRLGQLHK
jgi:hypothetical protein